jgi:phage terminase large subunit-like protein
VSTTGRKLRALFASTSSSSPNALLIAADICDPPEWTAAGRPNLEPHQIPPDGRWSLWLLEGGRGCGKTEACARYFAGYMRKHPGTRGRIIAPTYGDAVEACVRGPSGLLSMDPEIRFLASDPGGSKVLWPNGSEALVLGTPFPKDVDRLRAGGNRGLDWWEEMAANTQLQDAWDQAALGLRIGAHPHSIASTTPRTTKAYRGLRTQAGVVRTHATLFDNPHNPAEWVAQMRARYEGTRLGRQELGGELIEDVEGALWDRITLDECRVSEHPDLARVVVAVDPAATSTAGSSDTGIIVAGLGANGHGYILADRTCHLPPEGWGRRAVQAFEDHKADRIVAEVNNGGEMVKHVIRTVDTNVPYKDVRASRGKQTRAEPVAALFGNPSENIASRIHLVGGFPELEDQLTSWVPEDGESPDRLDAMVWAVTELMLGRQPMPDVGPVSVTGKSAWR